MSVQVPLNGIPSFHCDNCTTQFGVISNLAEGALNSILDVIDKDVKEHQHQERPVGDTPLVTSLHLDTEPLITTLCLRPFNQSIRWSTHQIHIPPIWR